MEAAIVRQKQEQVKKKLPSMRIYFWTLRYLFKYKFLFLAGLGCTLITSMVDLTIPKLIQHIIDVILPQKQLSQLYLLLGLLVPMVVLVICFTALRNLIQRVVQEKSSRDLQLSVLKKLRHLGFSYYEKHAAGETLSMFNNEVKVVQQLYNDYFPRLIQQSILLAVSLTIMLMMNIKLSLIIIPCFFSYYLVGPYFERKQALYAREAAVRKTEYNKKMYDSISSLLELRANNSEEWDRSRLKEKLHVFRSNSMSDLFYAMLRGTTRRFTVNAGAVFLFLIGASLVQSDQMTAGEFTAFMLYYFRVMGGLTGLVTSLTEQSVLLYQAERLHTFMHQAPEVSEPKQAVTLSDVKGSIHFDRVSFRYRDDMPVLHNFSLEVQPGEKIALVGFSGSGKSTVTKLLGRFYDPQEGEISIDGHSLKSLSFEQLRGAIGFVFQETYLFGTTIKENIRFGHPQATEDEIIQAAKGAFAHEFIMEAPQGYDTLVGERGMKLSGGQRQRIAVARMLLKNPSIIVLDEATSALDNISEKEVQSALDQLLAGRTTITVAHRLSTVRHYDRIAVMERGAIVEIGSYDELLRKQGLLYRMVEGSEHE